jgi:hypothetical protein
LQTLSTADAHRESAYAGKSASLMQKPISAASINLAPEDIDTEKAARTIKQSACCAACMGEAGVMLVAA